MKAYNPIDDPDQEHVQIQNVISVAGSFHTTDGKGLEPHYQRLKSKDSTLEGLELELNGGTYGKKNQQAIIQFKCDKDRTGNEGNEDAASRLRRRDDKDDDNQDGKIDDKNSLSFVSYGPEEGKADMDILRLDWRTKYACEDYIENDSSDKKGGWGFFTWLIVL